METHLIEIPLSKLVPSPSNVRRTGHDKGLDELAASIAHHGLLQSLSVKPVLGADGGTTGKYLVLGGGRRLAALKLLAKKKAIPKAHPVPCLVSEGNDEEISLAENVVRVDLHPADQFEAFRRLSEEQGSGAEEIAARFGVTPNLVKQRMRLGAVSPKLLALYREEILNLDQLMAFAITTDHARQEAIYDSLSWNKEPYTIRRLLTEAHVSVQDRRAIFVGLDAYEAAGGGVARDLFAEDDGGYLEDAGLLNRLALEKLEAIASEVLNEGWKWVEASIDFPHAHGLRRVYPETVPLNEEDEAELQNLQAQRDELTISTESLDELPDKIAGTFEVLEDKIEALEAKRNVYDADTVARGGVFIAIAYDGGVRIERGFIRPEDEPPAPETPLSRAEETGADAAATISEDEDAISGRDEDSALNLEDEGRKPLSDLLIRDLTAHRTLALRAELGANTEIAFLAVTHALAARLFYTGHDSGSCLRIIPESGSLGHHATGIEDTEAAAIVNARYEQWASHLPDSLQDLWAALAAWDKEALEALFAHCASLTVFAVLEPWERKPLTLQNASELAAALNLDMTRYWRPTRASYFSRVTKAQILDSVREGVSETAAAQLASAKKDKMAETAEELLQESGWLPGVLRTPAKTPALSEGTLS
jgi:ParB family chromosome partitioning protein